MEESLQRGIYIFEIILVVAVDVMLFKISWMGIHFPAHFAGILLANLEVIQMLPQLVFMLALDMPILIEYGGKLLEAKGAFNPRFGNYNLGSGINHCDL